MSPADLNIHMSLCTWTCNGKNQTPTCSVLCFRNGTKVSWPSLCL